MDALLTVTPLDHLLETLTGFERSLVSGLQLDGADLSLSDSKLTLAFPPYPTEEGHIFHKSFERLAHGQWQQVISLDIGGYLISQSTNLAWGKVESSLLAAADH